MTKREDMFDSALSMANFELRKVMILLEDVRDEFFSIDYSVLDKYVQPETIQIIKNEHERALLKVLIVADIIEHIETEMDDLITKAMHEAGEQ